MLTLALCPDKEYGRGCDFAEIHSRRVAFLYEKKSCAWDRGKADDAIRQLQNTIDDLLVRGVVDYNCRFSRAVIREKNSPHCPTDGTASAVVEARGATFIRAESEVGRKILQRYERRLAQYPP